MTAIKASFALHEAAHLKARLASPKPILYTHTLCPYAQRVFLTMLLKELNFEVVHVDLSDKPRWYTREVNRRGLVPAVTLDDRTLLESLDICRELDMCMPHLPLTPAEPAARQHMHALLDHTSGIVSAGLDMVAGSTARHWGVGKCPSRAQQQSFEAACQQLTDSLHQLGGPFLVGQQPSLADVALAPFFERFKLCLQLTQDYDFERLQGGAISEWLGALSKSPACQLASPSPDLFTLALKQHSSLDFFDYISYTAGQLHPQLKQYC